MDKDARIRELETLLAYEAAVIEAQARLDSESKHIGVSNKNILREQVEKMRSAAVGNGVVVDKRALRALIHEREYHGGNGWGCTACYERGLR
jgi:hypothetical protein